MNQYGYSWPSRAVARLFTWAVVKPFLLLVGQTGRTDQLWRWVGRKMHAGVVAGTDFRGYRPCAADVIVCTFPKCGTNWMLQIAHQIATCGRGDFEHVHDVVPWPDFRHQHMVTALDDLSVAAASPTGLRVIKTHLDFRRLPYSREARYICVLRDPKDAFVSSYHFIREIYFGPTMPSVDVWQRLYCSDDFPFDWAAHVHSCWQMRECPNVLVLRYEDMQADMTGCIARVARFLGVDLGPEEFAEVVRKSSFAYMKGIGHKFGPPAMTPFAERERTMIRRGVAGGSAELLSTAQQQAIDEHMKRKLAGLGSDFPYDEYYGSSGDAAGHC